MIKTEFSKTTLEIPKQTQSAIALLNSNYVVVDASDDWFKLFDLEPNDLKEKNWFQIFPSFTKNWRSRFEHTLHGVKGIKIVDQVVLTGGTSTDFEWCLNPWKDSSGKQFGISITVSATS